MNDDRLQAVSRETEARPRRRRLALALGLVTVGLGLAVAWVLMLTRPNVPTLPIPVPNGYADLIRASEVIAGTGPQFTTRPVRRDDEPSKVTFDPLPPAWDEAKAFLDANREVLAQARVGLDGECVVPLEFVSGSLFTGRYHNNLMNLAQVFHWEARLAIHEGRAADAARSYLDMIRLGQAAGRGGVESDFWVGNNIATGGLLGLVRNRDQLDAATCRRAVDFLGKLDEAREPYARFRERERAMQVVEQGWMRNGIARLANFRRIEEAGEVLDESVLELIAHARLVQVELALRAFEAETGGKPKNLAELVPAYLAVLPIDPYTGEPPLYRPTETGHLLYSVGGNRRDEGGKKPSSPKRVSPSKSGHILPDSLSTTFAP